MLRFDPSGGGWQPAAGDPTEGLDPTLHGNGGVAVGFGYDAAGRRDPAECSGSVWWTGEEFASSAGSQAVNGLAGRPEGASATWLIDFDDQFDDPQIRGWMSDVTVLRTCAPVVAGGPPPAPGPTEQPPAPEPTGQPPAPGVEQPPTPAVPPPPAPGAVEPTIGPEGPGPWPDWPFWPWWPDGPPPPPPLCPPGTHLANNGLQCCDGPQVPGPNGQCRSPCANGSTVAADMNQCRLGFQPLGVPPPAGTCWDRSAPVQVPGCAFPITACWKCPKPPHATCEGGNNFVTAVAAPTTTSDWSNADCPPGCPAGQTRGNDGNCHPVAAVCGPGSPATLTAWPVRVCCLNGTNPDPITGSCQPGLYVPQPWYLNYLATGSNPCPFPYTWCSFYEFTIRGEGRFGRGT